MAGFSDSVSELTSPSVDPAEVARFSAIADAWWDPRGKFKPLHRINPVRIGFIRDRLCAHFGLDPAAERPLEGLRVLDIGCGGGLLSEPLARLGARVTGVDASERNIKTAKTHAARMGVEVDYRHGTAELLAEAGETFDVVLNMEVVEHVTDPAAFLAVCGQLARAGGMMVTATINRTARAFALAIVGAEYVLGWLPRGTHQMAKFLRPDEIAGMLTSQGFVPEPPVGVVYHPLTGEWHTGRDTSVNYMLAAAKA